MVYHDFPIEGHHFNPLVVLDACPVRCYQQLSPGLFVAASATPRRRCTAGLGVGGLSVTGSWAGQSGQVSGNRSRMIHHGFRVVLLEHTFNYMFIIFYSVFFGEQSEQRMICRSSHGIKQSGPRSKGRLTYFVFWSTTGLPLCFLTKAASLALAQRHAENTFQIISETFCRYIVYIWRYLMSSIRSKLKTKKWI